jgi:hypothetical protein
MNNMSDEIEAALAFVQVGTHFLGRMENAGDKMDESAAIPGSAEAPPESA